jgi:hypothetical protein
MLDKLIAVAASIGVRLQPVNGVKIPAATGIKMML